MPEFVMLEQRWYPTRAGAEAAVRAVFHDHWPSLVAETAHERLYGVVDLLLARAPRDPSLAHELQSVFKLGLADASGYRSSTTHGRGEFMVCLQHTWALEALARWIAQRPADAPAPILLHIDAHDDLQSPSVQVAVERGRFAAPFGNETLDLHAPASVAPFVQRGLIGIGGFLTPFWHTIGAGHHIHVHPSNNTEPVTGWLQPAAETVAYWGGAYDRPTLSVVAHPGMGTITYIGTDDLSVIAAYPAEAPVLVNIDLDYFCDHYDDSETSRPATLPAASEVRCAIEDYVARLHDVLAGRVVELVIVACSPGFFPSVFWQDALAIASDLERLLDPA